jgi:hypothetical protein
MTRRLNIYLDDELAEELEKVKPRFLSLSAFCSCLLAESLDTGLRLPTYRVGAGKEIQVQEFFTKKLSSTDLLKEGINHPSENSLPLDNLGEVVGKEREETPKKPLFSFKQHKKLEPFWDKILAFWKVKKGSKSNQAFALQVTELEKILDDLGKDVLIEQLDSACLAGTWKQINYRRTVQFTEMEKKRKPEPDLKHPAYKVHTAKDLGYDNGPTTNTVLKELF